MIAENGAKSDPSMTYTLIFKVEVPDERNGHIAVQIMQQLYGQPLPQACSVGIYLYKNNNDTTEAPHTLSFLTHVT
jgi:hypothetical protein